MASWRHYITMTWGAAAKTAAVAIKVNRVKAMRHSLSRTIAANFQSFSIAEDSSSSRILSVITRISFKIRLSSLCTPGGKEVPRALSSVGGGRFGSLSKLICLMNPPLLCCGGCAWDGWWGWTWLWGSVEDGLKSSSISSTFASKDLEDFSFKSNSFILFCIMIVFRVIFSPGRDIRSSHGIHWRNTARTQFGISWVSASLWW